MPYIRYSIHHNNTFLRRPMKRLYAMLLTLSCTAFCSQQSKTLRFTNKADNDITISLSPVEVRSVDGSFKVSSALQYVLSPSKAQVAVEIPNKMFQNSSDASSELRETTDTLGITRKKTTKTQLIYDYSLISAGTIAINNFVIKKFTPTNGAHYIISTAEPTEKKKNLRTPKITSPKNTSSSY